MKKEEVIHIKQQLFKLENDSIDESIIIESFDSRILKLKNAEISTWFCTHFNSPRVKEHEQIVIDSKDPELSFIFAKDVKGADKNALVKVVIESNDLEYNRRFLYGINGYDKEAHCIALAKKDKYELLLEFITDITRGTYYYMPKPKCVKYNDAPIQAIFALFVESKDPYINYKVAYLLYNKIDITRFIEVVMNNDRYESCGGNNDISYYTYLAAKNIPNAPIDKLREAVIKSKEPKENYLFALEIPGTLEDMKKHEQVVLDSDNAEYNYLFAKNIAGNDFEAHKKVVLTHRNDEHIEMFNELINEKNIDEQQKSKIKKLENYLDKLIG